MPGQVLAYIHMHTIGILGGVASGKSQVAEQFQSLGAGRLDADRAGHEVLRLPETVAAAKERWGPAVLDAEGRIDRASLARIVFATTDEAAGERKYLESLTHPAIRERLEAERRELEASGCPVAVLDAPLLLESGWARLCDTLVLVDTPRSRRLEWARQRGWSEEELANREAAQQSVEVKRRHAKHVIDNSGSLDETMAQVVGIWNSLVRQ